MLHFFSFLKAEPEKAGKPKAAKKEASRVKFNATELKIFKKIVESAGSTVTDELKQEFVDYVTPMTAEQFAVVALEGHMRAFVDSKKQGAVAATAQVPADDDEEDLPSSCCSSSKRWRAWREDFLRSPPASAEACIHQIADLIQTEMSRRLHILNC